MKLLKTRDVISNIGVDFDTRDYEIAVNAKSFRVLFDSLYTDKISSIIRELWTNALDAHREVGAENTPFHCHFPTVLEPYFSVRDYGVSMDHERVMKLYRTVFGSSKQDTNDQVGCFGLGSKAPFAYTDSFTVTTWLNGEKRVYISAFGDDGMPRISFINSEASDEARGVEILFAVNATDIGQWSKRAESISLPFDVKPTANVEMDWPELKTVIEMDGWKVVNIADTPTTFRQKMADSIIVRQGCVFYPVKTGELGFQVNHTHIEPRLRYDEVLLLDMPIGTVDVAASREALSLDKVTKANIIERLTKFYDDITGMFMHDLSSATNSLSIWKITNNWPLSSTVIRKVLAAHGYPESQLREFVKFRKEELPSIRRMVNSTKLVGHEAKDMQIYYHTAHKLRIVVERSNQKVVRKLTRFKDYANTYSNNREYILLVTDPSSKFLERLIRAVGVAPEHIISLDSLPDPGPTVSSSPTGKKLSGVWKWSGIKFFKADSGSGPTLDTKWVWVSIERGAASAKTDLPYAKHKQVAGLGKVIGWVQQIMGDETLTVYGLTANAVKRIDPPTDRHMETIIRDYVNKHLADYLKYIETRGFRKTRAVSTTHLSLPVLNVLFPPNPEGPSISNLVPLGSLTFSEHGFSSSAFMDILGHYHKTRILTALNDREFQAQAILEKYPLLQQRKHDEDIVREYVEFINNKTDSKEGK